MLSSEPTPTLLSPADSALVEAARAVIRTRHRPGRHVVGAALRTRAGAVFTGVHLEATVGRVAVCAEAIALGRAATEAGDTEIDAIVAVYHPGLGVRDPVPVVVAPCGLCREMIGDYAPGARVLVPGPDGIPIAVPIAALLPHKFQHPAA